MLAATRAVPSHPREGGSSPTSVRDFESSMWERNDFELFHESVGGASTASMAAIKQDELYDSSNSLFCDESLQLECPPTPKKAMDGLLQGYTNNNRFSVVNEICRLPMEPPKNVMRAPLKSCDPVTLHQPCLKNDIDKGMYDDLLMAPMTALSRGNSIDFAPMMTSLSRGNSIDFPAAPMTSLSRGNSIDVLVRAMLAPPPRPPSEAARPKPLLFDDQQDSTRKVLPSFGHARSEESRLATAESLLGFYAPSKRSLMDPEDVHEDLAKHDTFPVPPPVHDAETKPDLVTSFPQLWHEDDAIDSNSLSTTMDGEDASISEESTVNDDNSMEEDEDDILADDTDYFPDSNESLSDDAVSLPPRQLRGKAPLRKKILKGKEVEQPKTKKPRRVAKRSNTTKASAKTPVKAPVKQPRYKRALSGPHKQASKASSKRQGPPKFRKYQAESWSTRFLQLQDFVSEYGHGMIPHNFPPNQRLARWAKRQRYQYKLYQAGNEDSAMTASRLNLLNSVGFCWDAHESQWSLRFEELKDFQKARGHCNVPSGYSKNKRLATWVKCQRRQYKVKMANGRGNISDDRIKLLNAVGFQWTLEKTSEKS